MGGCQPSLRQAVLCSLLSQRIRNWHFNGGHTGRVSARKKIMGGGTIRKHKFAKKGDLSSEHFLEGLH